MPGDLRQFMQCRRSRLSNIEIIGLGCNLACYGGVKPNDAKMQALSDLVGTIEQELGLKSGDRFRGQFGELQLVRIDAKPGSGE